MRGDDLRDFRLSRSKKKKKLNKYIEVAGAHGRLLSVTPWAVLL